MIDPKPFTIMAPPKILFGRGQAASAAGIIRGFGAKVLLLHGASASRAAWLIGELGGDVETFACGGEPSLEMLDAGLDVGRRARPDVVVALGGGAVIDLAKALAALIPAPGAPLDHLEVVGRGAPLVAKPLPFIALPTTAGTGAEVTKNAVIGVPDARRKVSLRDASMIADVAIVDPALTDNCPRAVTLASGLDALAQVIEPYVSCKANAYTDALCRTAIPQGIAALSRLMVAEDEAARDAMAWVSLSGGLALANSGLGAVHGLAGVIGGWCGAPHGAVCGALLPHVITANLAALDPDEDAHARLTWVADQIAGCLGEHDGPQALERWARGAGLPGLTSWGLREDEFPAVAEAAGASSSMKGNPVSLPAGRLVDVMRRAM